MKENLRVWLFFLFVTTLFAQFLVWKSFVFEASYLQVLEVTGLATVEQKLELGAICNSLDKFECSEEVFSEILANEPRHRVALANLAIARSKQGKWTEALPAFEDYFFIGGNGYDVMYWYAQSLIEQGELARGIDWLYKSLVQKQDYLEAANELVDQLAENGRTTEALSLVASLTGGRPWGDPYWRAKMAVIENHFNQNENSEAELVRLPALRGRSFYVPLRLKPEGALQFFMINGETEESTVGLELFPQHRMKAEDEVSSQESLVLDNVVLGPWPVSEFSVRPCEGCSAQLGREWLKKVNIEKQEEEGIHFLILKR